MRLFSLILLFAFLLGAYLIQPGTELVLSKMAYAIGLGAVLAVVLPTSFVRGAREKMFPVLAFSVMALGILVTVMFQNFGSFTYHHLGWLATVISTSAIVYAARSHDELVTDRMLESFVGLSAVWGLLQWMTLVPPMFDSYLQVDFAGPFGLSNFTAELVAPLTVWIIVRQFARAKIDRFALIVAVMSISYLLVAGVRAGWLGLAIGIGFGLMVLSNSEGHRDWYKKAGAAILGLCAVAIGYVLFVPGPSDKFRLFAWLSSLRLIEDYPMGVGVGWFPDAVQNSLSLGSMVEQAKSQHRIVDPHNDLIRVVVEYGVLGGGLIIALFLRWLRVVKNIGNAPVLAGIVSWLAMSLIAFPSRGSAGAIALGILFALWTLKTVSLSNAKLSERLAGLVVFVAFAILSLTVLNVSRAEQLMTRGKVLARVGQPTLQVHKYRQANNIMPSYRPAREAYFRYAVESGEVAIASRSIEEFIDSRFVPASLALEAFSAAVASGEHLLAARWYHTQRESLLEVGGPGRMQIGNLLVTSGMTQLAEDWLVSSGLIETSDGVLLSIQILADRGEFEPAIRLLERQINLDPDYISLHLAQITLLADTGNIGEALRKVETLVDDNPDNGQVHLYAARVYWQDGQRDKAILFVRKAYARTPGMSIDAESEPDPIFRSLFKAIVREMLDEKGVNVQQLDQKPQ